MTHTRTIALAALSVALVPFFALAADTAAVNTSASVTAPGLSATVGASATTTAFITRAQNRGNQELDRRVTNLQNVLSRVSGIKNLSADNVASIQTTIQNNITALTSLKAKIDADTDEATVRADVKSVTDSYRVYALILPQIRIIAAADRIVTVAVEMNALSAKLHTRVSAATASGADMTAAIAALTDFDAKVGDAEVKAQAAVTAIATLTPDQGDAATKSANTKALQSARADVIAAQKDLIAARADAKIIVSAVKGKPVSASASGTASSTTQTGN